MNFIGLDLSLTSTGMVVLPSEGNIPLKWEHISTQPNLMHYISRYESIACRIVDAYCPQAEDYILIEDYAFNKKFGLAQSGELGGIVKYYLSKYTSVPLEHIWTVSSTTLKKFVLGAGKGDKNLILREVFKKYQFEAINDDVSDAYVLAAMMRKTILPNIFRFDYEEECCKVVVKRNGLLGKAAKSPRRKKIVD